jgi:2-succinyl-5-enolpyruvyl-6-hydroxy-3-cyclohexene-1-carboxylate synthase
VPDLSQTVPDGDSEVPEVPASADPVSAAPRTVVPRAVPHGKRTVVIAGHAAGERAEEFARAGGWPLLAEVSSGARFGPNLVVAFRQLLKDAEFGDRVERAIVFGHPTLTREVPGLLRRDDVEVIVVGPSGGQWYNPGRTAELVSEVHVTGGPEDERAARGWLGRWVFTSRAILDAEAEAAEPTGRSDGRDYARLELAALRAPVTRRALVEAVWRATWPHDRLVLGASRLIREADGSVPGKKIRVHANRGLAGIDGTIATATGIALASQRTGAGATRVLVGDLTLLHDAGSLLGGHGEQLPRIQVIVGNDGGGTIFDGLEVARTAHPTAIERVMFTPQSADIESLARAYGWAHSRATTAGELHAALTAPVTGPSILEVPLPR